MNEKRAAAAMLYIMLRDGATVTPGYIERMLLDFEATRDDEPLDFELEQEQLASLAKHYTDRLDQLAVPRAIL